MCHGRAMKKYYFKKLSRSSKHQIFKVNNKQNGEEALSQFVKALTYLDIGQIVLREKGGISVR